MASVEDETGLIKKAVTGDSAALEILLFHHRKRLLAYLRKHFPDALRASLEPEDILQDTWLRAIRAISEFRPTASDPVYRWLVTIARNLISDQVKYIRSAKRKGTRILLQKSADEGSIAGLLEELALYHRTPSKSAANQELMAALDSAIERLPDDQAQALQLRYLKGLDIKIIAQQMQRSPGSVSMLCNRALKSLRWEMRSVSLYI
jgi:RNA polymerase sigma-70 factor, ECF subfamily